mmetsp:Transcript_47313/g.118160  ORF Transcript_47313/g.118160 Transcript_47313/m.118160 type:complete len:80 (-) Transcript_47313:654-893(-)
MDGWMDALMGGRRPTFCLSLSVYSYTCLHLSARSDERPIPSLDRDTSIHEPHPHHTRESTPNDASIARMMSFRTTTERA